GPIRAGVVLSAVGGWVSQVAAMARIRLPVRTHPLHAFVTNDFEQGLDKIVASTELACYVSQTERGQMLIGAEFDSQPSFSRLSSFDALRSYAYKISALLPFLRSMRILRTGAGLCDIPDDRDFDEVWVFENPAGITNERSFHSAGCRRWLTVRRDTNADRVVEIA